MKLYLNPAKKYDIREKANESRLHGGWWGCRPAEDAELFIAAAL